MNPASAQIQPTLLALKNGVVPENTLAFGVKREKILKEFENIFTHVHNGHGLIKFVAGPYGTGKSFMLQQLQEKAWQDNFIVAKIQMEKGLRLHDFQTLYYHVMHSLTTNESKHHGTSFPELFKQWLKQLKHDTDTEESSERIKNVISELNQYNLSFSRAFLYYVRASIQNDQEMANAVASWLTGERNIPQTLKKRFEIVGQIDHTNAIHFFKAFIKLIKMLGYSGLVILIDELEIVMNERSDVRTKAYQNLRYLIDNTYNNQLSDCLFVFATTNDWLSNEQKGPKTYPALLQRIGHASESKQIQKNDLRQPVIQLQPLTSKEISELTDNILELFDKAYEFKLQISQQSLQNWVTLLLKKEGIELKEISVRTYITKLVEVLDLMEQDSDSTMFNKELKAVTDGDTIRYVQKM